MESIQLQEPNTKKSNVYVSLDIETTGPIPGINAMLSLGAAAYNEGGEFLLDFDVNLQITDGFVWDTSTRDWWNKQSDAAWLGATRFPVPPDTAMYLFRTYLHKLMQEYSARVTFVCWPTIYDMPFVQYYYARYGVRDIDIKLHNVIDIKTMAMLALGTSYLNTRKQDMPRIWFPPDFIEHSHIAVEDAKEQGYMFFQIRKSLSNALDPHIPSDL